MTREEREKRSGRRSFHSYYDYSLLFLTIFLSFFGLVIIYSSSSFTSQVKFSGDAGHFMRRQLYAIFVGVAAMLVISKINYRLYIKKLPIFGIRLIFIGYLVAFILQIAVLIFGEEINGAKRWIVLPVLGNFQPSEFSKVVAIVFVAYIVQKAPKELNKVSGFIRVVLCMAPLIGLILKENLSTSLVMIAITVGICFVASKKKWYYFVFAILMVAGILAFIYGGVLFGVGFRVSRIDAWLNVETHKKGYQILQGLYAIASGGLFGTGLGQSMQKLGFIPEAYNDMVFCIICEELGLVGAIAVILLFVLLLWRIFLVSISAPDLYGGLLCTGVLTHIAVQVIINIAVVTNSIPSTGIPLPFISYGGTSIAVLLAEMGLVLSVSNQIRYTR